MIKEHKYFYCHNCHYAFEIKSALPRSCPKCHSVSIEVMGDRFHEVIDIYINPSRRDYV